MGISFTVKTSPPDVWYGTLEISNIQLDGNPLTVNNILGVSFNVPKNSFKSVDVSTNIGSPPTSYTIDYKDISSSTIQVNVYFRFSSSFTFKPDDTLTFNVNGDMSNPQEVEKTISLTNDP